MSGASRKMHSGIVYRVVLPAMAMLLSTPSPSPLATSSTGSRRSEVPALLVGDLSFTEKVPLCAQQGMREFIAWDHCRGIRKGYNKGPFLIPPLSLKQPGRLREWQVGARVAGLAAQSDRPLDLC